MLNTHHRVVSGSGPRLSQIVTRKLADCGSRDIPPRLSLQVCEGHLTQHGLHVCELAKRCLHCLRPASVLERSCHHVTWGA